MLDNLQHNWDVVMPDGGGISTTFLIRPDEQLILLPIGRHVNGGKFGSAYSLIRMQGSGYAKFWYNRAYNELRATTPVGDGKAFFNMIDAATRRPGNLRGTSSLDPA